MSDCFKSFAFLSEPLDWYIKFETHKTLFAYSNLIVSRGSAMRLIKRKLIVQKKKQSSVVAVVNIRGLSK